MALPEVVKIVEVGPRDGLQNEKKPISTNLKLEFIHKLAATGLTHIEATSFVSAKKIPQLSDHDAVLSQLDKSGAINYPVLVPNLQGYERALHAGAKEIAFFTAVSETFCERNINCSIEESLQRFQAILARAQQDDIRVRAYLSCIVACPYEGPMKPQTVADLSARLIDMGAYEISLGDTTGVGTPLNMTELFQTIQTQVDLKHCAAHFHNTYGQALANLFAVLNLGIQTIDSSVAGLGGCPYAKGASGNVATEDVIYMLEGCGIKTGVNLERLVAVSHFICDSLGIEPRSSLARIR